MVIGSLEELLFYFFSLPNFTGIHISDLMQANRLFVVSVLSILNEKHVW